MAWVLRFEKPVRCVLGHHEFYGSSTDGVRYLGTTLWTDFELLGDAEKKATAICGYLDNAGAVSPDFRRPAMPGTSPRVTSSHG